MTIIAYYLCLLFITGCFGPSQIERLRNKHVPKGFPEIFLAEKSISKELGESPNLEALRHSLTEFDSENMAFLASVNVNETQAQEIAKVYRELNEIENKVYGLAKLGRAQESDEEFSNLDERRFALKKQLEQDFPQLDAINEAFVIFANSYCGSCLSVSKGDITGNDYREYFEEDPKMVLRVRSVAQQLIRGSASNECFTTKGMFRSSKACRSMLDRCKYFALQSKNKDLYIEFVRPDFTTIKTSVSTFESFVETTQAAIKPSREATRRIKREYLFCRAISLSGVPLEAKPTGTSEFFERSTSRWPTFVGFGKDGIKDCVRLMPTTQENDRLEALEQRGVTMVDLYLKYRDSFVEQCRKNARDYCENIYKVGGKVIYTYKTVGGKERSVTRGDVIRDIRSWRSLGMEEAAILEHGEILKKIEACELAMAHQLTF